MPSTWVAFSGFEEDKPFRAAKPNPQMYWAGALHDKPESGLSLWQGGSELGWGSAAGVFKFTFKKKKKKKKKSFLWCSLISNFIPRFLSFSASPLLFPCVGFNRKFYRTRLYSQSVIKTARLSFSLHKPLDGSNCLDFLHHKALCQPAI